MACLESAFYEDHVSQDHVPKPGGGGAGSPDWELLRLYAACVDTDRCQRTQRLLADDIELDWFGVHLQGVGRVMAFLQSELPVTHHEYTRAERVPHICRRVRKRPSLAACSEDDPALAASLLALSLLPPPQSGAHSRHSSISAGSDSSFSLCSSFDDGVEEPAGPMTMLRVSGSLAFDGRWADRDALDGGAGPLPPPPEGKWRRRMRLSIGYTCAPLKIHKLYYEENSKARRALNFS